MHSLSVSGKCVKTKTILVNLAHNAAVRTARSWNTCTASYKKEWECYRNQSSITNIEHRIALQIDLCIPAYVAVDIHNSGAHCGNDCASDSVHHQAYRLNGNIHFDRWHSIDFTEWGGNFVYVHYAVHSQCFFSNIWT